MSIPPKTNSYNYATDSVYRVSGTTISWCVRGLLTESVENIEKTNISVRFFAPKSHGFVIDRTRNIRKEIAFWTVFISTLIPVDPTPKKAGFGVRSFVVWPSGNVIIIIYRGIRMANGGGSGGGNVDASDRQVVDRYRSSTTDGRRTVPRRLFRTTEEPTGPIVFRSVFAPSRKPIITVGRQDPKTNETDRTNNNKSSIMRSRDTAFPRIFPRATRRDPRRLYSPGTEIPVQGAHVTSQGPKRL